mmetsp:Transcript_27552/g.55462  ORF Transcript_27552/g.55462 Transcript_27552/m.55462 type:complete len:233 (-) Transcript_27552:403-1101(-)
MAMAAMSVSLVDHCCSSLNSVSLWGPRLDHERAAEPSSEGGPYSRSAWRFCVRLQLDPTRRKPQRANTELCSACFRRWVSRARATSGLSLQWSLATPSTTGSTSTSPHTRRGGDWVLRVLLRAKRSQSARAWKHPVPCATTMRGPFVTPSAASNSRASDAITTLERTEEDNDDDNGGDIGGNPGGDGDGERDGGGDEGGSGGGAEANISDSGKGRAAAGLGAASDKPKPLRE